MRERSPGAPFPRKVLIRPAGVWGSTNDPVTYLDWSLHQAPDLVERADSWRRARRGQTADTVIGPDDDVFVPRGSERTDYEVELAVVIGQTARYLGSPAESQAVIAGYAISNDVSEREFQLDRGGQWDKGKSCETFNPLGPWLVTADEVPDP